MYLVNGESFRTKKLVKDRVVEIKGRYSIGDRVGDGDAEFLTALLRSHPDKEPQWFEGFDHYFIDRKDYGTVCFYVRRSDGSKSAWSYNKCIKNLKKGDER